MGKEGGRDRGVKVGLGFAAHCERSFLHRTRWGQHSAVCEARERERQSSIRTRWGRALENSAARISDS